MTDTTPIRLVDAMETDVELNLQLNKIKENMDQKEVARYSGWDFWSICCMIKKLIYVSVATFVVYYVFIRKSPTATASPPALSEEEASLRNDPNFTFI